MKHEFSIGDRVEVVPTGANPNVRAGLYTIVRLLPVSGNTCQYRAKNALEAHERVLDQSQLRRAAAAGAR